MIQRKICKFKSAASNYVQYKLSTYNNNNKHFGKHYFSFGFNPQMHLALLTREAACNPTGIRKKQTIMNDVNKDSFQYSAGALTGKIIAKMSTNTQ